MAEKMTIEKLAEMTLDEFRSVRKETKEIAQLLNEKIDDGFGTIRGELQESTRAILAAIEQVWQKRN